MKFSWTLVLGLVIFGSSFTEVVGKTYKGLGSIASGQEAIDKAYSMRFSARNPALFRNKKKGGLASGEYASAQKKARERHTDLLPTKLLRTGDFTSINDYAYRRANSNTRYIRHNANQVFRARALDYYVYGGNAGEEAMSRDLIYASTHRVDRGNSSYSSKNDAGVVKNIRNAQKNFLRGSKAGDSSPIRPFSQRKIGNIYSLPFFKLPYSN